MSERIRVAAGWGFVLPCAFYLFVGLALYPQLGAVAEILNVPLSGSPGVPEWLAMSTIFMALGVLGVFLHELGHALWIARRLKSPATVWLGASTGVRHALPEGVPHRMAALCGPLVQGAYGAVVLTVSNAAGALFIAVLGALSIADAAYNLLPLRGHDGRYVFGRGAKAPKVPAA